MGLIIAPRGALHNANYCSNSLFHVHMQPFSPGLGPMETTDSEVSDLPDKSESVYIASVCIYTDQWYRDLYTGGTVSTI